MPPPLLRVKVLAILDTLDTANEISEVCSQDGLEISAATAFEVGLERVFREHPQIVLLDLALATANGMEALERIAAFDPDIEVVLMTDRYSADSAMEAIRNGASDYLSKPVSLALLRDRVGKVVEAVRQRQRALDIESELLAACRFEGMIGRSAAMWELFTRIRRLAPHFHTVLVTGAAGTGKELVARALHRLSPVSDGRYVVCDCSAVQEALLEGELFGYVKGAFAGTTQDKMGLLEYAHNGTLFLDEIGGMPVKTQAKLLHALQHQEIHRVGSHTPHKINVRVIASTNHDLTALIAQERFRKDLYDEISMYQIRTPSLSERREDLSLLECYFVRKFSEQYQKSIREITQRAQVLLAGYAWPGNVRELHSAVESACVRGKGGVIDVADLPDHIRSQPVPATSQNGQTGRASEVDEDLFLDRRERLLLASALERSGGNQCQAARLLGISRDRMRSKMAKHRLR